MRKVGMSPILGMPYQMKSVRLDQFETVSETRAREMLDLYQAMFPGIKDIHTQFVERQVWIADLKRNNRRNKRMRRHG